MPPFAGKPWKDEETGLQIYQDKRSKKGTFYYRYMPPGTRKWIEKSTGIHGDINNPCAPPLSAIRAAVTAYERIQAQVAAGIAPTSKMITVLDAADGLIKELNHLHGYKAIAEDRYKNRVGFLNNYVIPYEPFRTMPITSFDRQRLRDWVDFTIGDKVRSKSTLDKWEIYLTDVFRHAAGKRWISEEQIPSIKIIVDNQHISDPTTNPRFTEEQWQALIDCSQAFIDACEDPYDKGCREIVILMSEVSYAYGLRAAETNELLTRYVHLDERRYVIDVPKVKHFSHERTVIPLDDWVERTAEIFETDLPAYFAEYGIDRSACPYLFARPNGDRVNNLNAVFDKWISFSGIVSNKGKYTFTSFRHTYINEWIEKTNLSDAVVAGLAGTSTDMLHRHYKQAFNYRQVLLDRYQRDRNVVAPVQKKRPHASPAPQPSPPNGTRLLDLD